MSRHCKDCRWKYELVNQPHCHTCIAFSNWSPELDSMQSTIRKYIENDIESTHAVLHEIFNSVINSKKHSNSIPAIKDVIFNPPATIIIWEDKTKTIVKCGENDIYDPEKGMAMAISRKALGDRGSYYNVFEKWVNPYIEKCEEFKVAHPVQSAIYETLSNMSAKTDKLRKVINDMSEKVLSHTDELKGEVTSSDISEYDHKESNDFKDCCNCKYHTYDCDEEPCDTCLLSPENRDFEYKWTPKESDD